MLENGTHQHIDNIPILSENSLTGIAFLAEYFYKAHLFSFFTHPLRKKQKNNTNNDNSFS
ncbi:hypothetical protein PU02_0108 [Bartonella ancashensis]|uniref:Uncharacterized protein n=1 Tax=Bartonella ancashensis TaxID=1318743 RepID=A0A0M4LRP1_9HYPH|nr:hypothetical protein PU02_0108 [Bartonella ancashensis]